MMSGGLVIVGVVYLLCYVVPYGTMLLVWAFVGLALARRIGSSITLSDSSSTIARSAFLAIAAVILAIGFYSNKFSPVDVVYRTLPVFAALFGCIAQAQNPPIMRRVATGVLLLAAMLPPFVWMDTIQTPSSNGDWSAGVPGLLLTILSGPLIAIGTTTIVLNPRRWPTSVALVAVGLVALPIAITAFVGQLR